MEVLDHDDIRRILSAFDRLRRPRGPWLVVALLVISTLMFGSWALVYATGGTQYVYLHSMYVPILLAAFMFGARGGLVTGLVGGVVLGPFMPLDVPEGVSQSTTAWMLRVGFFALVGTIAGSLSSLLSLRLTMVERLAQTLSVTYSRTLKTFAMGVEVRDEPTGAHCERVAHNACAVGRELGFEGREMEMLQWAGLLHDLGKIATPEHILLKPGKLTDEEYEEMKRHAAVGAEMIETISPDFSDIAAGVRSHHERWDGGGYPDGVAGESIPLVGRILAVVDVFEALTSRRPYRRPMPPEEALAYLGERAGTHFDPRVVPIFERLYREGEIYVSEVPDEKVELDASLILEEEGAPRTEEVGEKTG